MDEATRASLSIVISAVALLISIFSISRARKSHVSGTLSSQRLVWAENLRVAVSSLIVAMHKGEELAPYRARVLLYLSPQNSSHKKLINVVNDICAQSSRAADLNARCDRLVGATQDVLHKNWWMVKSELGLSAAEETRRDAKFEKLQSKHGSR